MRLLTDGPTEQTITVDLAPCPRRSANRHRRRHRRHRDFGDVGAIQITATLESARPLARATLDAATTERTMLLAEIYRRGPVWRLRAVGQGYDHGLDALARGYGVDVEGYDDISGTRVGGTPMEPDSQCCWTTGPPPPPTWWAMRSAC